MRGEGLLALSPGELGFDSRELRRETIRLAAISVLRRMGPSRRRPLGSSDELPAIDGPVAKSQTRDRVNWLATHEGACFLPETGGGHSVVSWMGSVVGARSRQAITPAQSVPESVPAAGPPRATPGGQPRAMLETRAVFLSRIGRCPRRRFFRVPSRPGVSCPPRARARPRGRAPDEPGPPRESSFARSPVAASLRKRGSSIDEPMQRRSSHPSFRN